MNQTIEVILKGRVQGVGMRFFINRQASRFGLNGYVRNQYNGTVQAVFQGDPNTISNLLQYIKKYSPGTIDDLVITEIHDSKEYHKFTIKLF